MHSILFMRLCYSCIFYVKWILFDESWKNRFGLFCPKSCKDIMGCFLVEPYFTGAQNSKESVGWKCSRCHHQISHRIFWGFIQKGFFGAFWYLGALMIIYILLLGLTLLSKNKIRILMQSVLAICVSLYSISLFVGESVQKYVIQTFRIWTWLFYFLLGGKISNITAWLSERISLKSHGALLGHNCTTDGYAAIFWYKYNCRRTK